MYKIRCLNCGALQGNGVQVRKTLNDEVVPKRNGNIGDRLTTEYQCDGCDSVERIEGGVLPELEAQDFDSIWNDNDCKSTTLLIDGVEVQFESVDEQIAENSYYSPEGIRGTSTVHHLHVHAINPPSVSKGSHTVKFGEFIDDEFVLASIRYHDSNHRTLKFYKSVPNDLPEPISDTATSTAQTEFPR